MKLRYDKACRWLQIIHPQTENGKVMSNQNSGNQFGGLLLKKNVCFFFVFDNVSPWPIVPH